MIVGYWNEESDLQYPYAIVGALRGMHIIENEEQYKAW